MIPNTEPNSLPQPFADWQEWRETYTVHVDTFNKSEKTFSDRLLLEIRLKRLGFVGTRLDEELMYVQENA